MIECSVQAYVKKKWLTAKKLGVYRRVEDARRAMYAVKAQYGVPARILSKFGTVVDATYLDDAEGW